MTEHGRARATSLAYRAAFRQELVRTVSAGPRRRTSRVRAMLAGGLGICVVGGGAAVAYSVISQAPVTDHRMARCYSSDEYVSGPDFPGTSVAEAGTASAPGRVGDAQRACAAVWRVGILRPGVNGATAPPANAGPFPVPDLFVCVLPDGQAAVFPTFPGNTSNCSEFGLPGLS